MKFNYRWAVALLSVFALGEFATMGRSMKKILRISAMCATVLLSNLARSATVTLDMEGPPSQPPGTTYAISQYFEDGFHLRPKGPIATTPPYDLARNGGSNSFSPENGGAYLQLLFGDSLVISSVDGLAFNVFSIDLAEYSIFVPTKIIGFRGFKTDGTFIDTQFVTDGVIDGTAPLADFETFLFPDTFRDLSRLEATTDGFSLDNVVVATVPVPASALLFISGFLGLIQFHVRCAHRRNIARGTHTLYKH